MKNAPILPSFAPAASAQLAEPRESITQFVGEICRDLEASKFRLSEVETVDELAMAVTDTHKTLMEHERTLGQFAQIVQDWSQASH